MKYNRQKLIEQFQQEEALKYLFFWGHTPSKDGTITKSCLSQWWVSPFEFEGNVYQTAEHWMMAEKARLFHDNKIAAKIIKTEHSIMAKKLGREVNNFVPEEWTEKRSDIVVEGNRLKFSQHENLKTFLLYTGNRVLVEASPRDVIWGIGLGGSNPNAENPNLWRGENLLGFALMEVRDLLNLEINSK